MPRSKLTTEKKIEVIEYFRKYKPTFGEVASATKISATTARELYLASMSDPGILTVLRLKLDEEE